FRAPKARSVDGHIIVDLEATAVDDEFDHAFGFGYLTSGFPYRSGRAVGVNYSHSGVVMLKGTTKVRPMDYYFGDGVGDAEIWLPATDFLIRSRIDSGQTLTFSLIYPQLDDVDTVTIQAGPALGVTTF